MSKIKEYPWCDYLFNFKDIIKREKIYQKQIIIKSIRLTAYESIKYILNSQIKITHVVNIYKQLRQSYDNLNNRDKYILWLYYYKDKTIKYIKNQTKLSERTLFRRITHIDNIMQSVYKRMK